MTDKSDSPEMTTPDAFGDVGVVHIETDAFSGDAIQLFEFDQDALYEMTMSDPEVRNIMMRNLFELALVDQTLVPQMAQLSAMDMTEVTTEWQALSADLANRTVKRRIMERRAAGLASTTFGLLD
jgi:hypothetical protein